MCFITKGTIRGRRQQWNREILMNVVRLRRTEVETKADVEAQLDKVRAMVNY